MTAIPLRAAPAPAVPRAKLLFAATKRGWADIHTAISMVVAVVAVTHVAVVRSGLAADMRLLATGQRSSPRRVAR